MTERESRKLQEQGVSRAEQGVGCTRENEQIAPVQPSLWVLVIIDCTVRGLLKYRVRMPHDAVIQFADVNDTLVPSGDPESDTLARQLLAYCESKADTCDTLYTGTTEACIYFRYGK